METRKELLERVNAAVNCYPYETDNELWGQPDYWERISIKKRGDCEDYVMEKRQQLIDAGVPVDDLRIAICHTETGECHAVLIASDPESGGDWVLDQRQPGLCTADQLKGLGYQGDQLQVPNSWIWERWEL